MLTADLVRARRRGGALQLLAMAPSGPKGEADREACRVLAERILRVLRDHEGQPRAELMQAFDGIPVSARRKKIAMGLRKLALDAAEFDTERGKDAPALRAEVFRAAAKARREAESQGAFDRDGLLDTFALAHGLSADELVHALYADLRGQQPLVKAPLLKPEHLLERYELGQAQAVLLRATEVVVEIREPHAPTLRNVLHKLKFHGLMHRIEVESEGKAATTRITLDGPMSLFRASTKYGLALALVLPAIRACARYELQAKVLWGKNRDELSFKLEGGRGLRSGVDDLEAGPADEVGERPEVSALVSAFEKKPEGWRPTRDGAILHIPGLGACVPDLCFVHDDTGAKVYFEVLGFWSRDAVIRRIDLAEAGLDAPILFAVPARLRVSEALLDADVPASLYVFKGVLSRKAIRERLDALRPRSAGAAK